MSHFDVAKKIVSTVASVPMGSTGDANRDFAQWGRTATNLVAGIIAGVYIVHDPMGRIKSVHLSEADAEAVAKGKDKVLTWEVK